MRSWWIRPQGHSVALELREVPEPQPATGEIVLRVRATALNRGQFIAGGVMHGASPRIGGTEAAGEVVALGPGVEGFAAGDRVMGRALGPARGTFAEYCALDAREALPVPERLTWEQAAAIPVSFLTAYDALFAYGGLRQGQWLLVVGASSATGVACIQTGAFLGARVIGTSGSQEKLARLEPIGLAAGLRTRGPDFAERVREMTGAGADRAVNLVGGSVFGECLRALALGGRLAMVGYVDRVFRSEIDLRALHAGRRVVFGTSNTRIPAAARAETVRGFARKVLPAIASGRITPLIDRVFGFDELPAARRYMESDAQVGKIVVRLA